MSGRHERPRRPGPDPLWYVVGGGAALVRIALGLLLPVTPYSGDSWCLLHLGASPLCASHPPTISWIWRALTLGVFTQTSVLVLQGVLGVLGALVLFALLRRVADRRLAAAAALLVAATPVELFMERSIMTEAIETLLLLVALWLAMGALRSKRRSVAHGYVAAATVVLGIDAAIHAAIALTVVVLTILLVGLTIWRQASARTPGSTGLLVLVPVVAAVALLVPSLPMAARYESTFGTFSTQAMAGTYLAASWAPLLDCPAPAGSQPVVAAFYAVACTHHDFGDPPGVVAKLMWAPSLSFLRTAPAPSQRRAYARAQAALEAAALSGIAHRPASFLSEVGRSLWSQVAARSSTRALHVYSTGWPHWKAAQGASGPTARATRSWFGGVVPSATRPSHDLASAVRMTDWLPQVVLWLAGLGGLVRAVFAWRRRRDEADREPSRGWWRRPPADRVCLGLMSAAIVATGLLAWAVGSWPIFRLWAPLLPAVVILAALAVPDRRPPTAEPGPVPTSTEPAAVISG